MECNPVMPRIPVDTDHLNRTASYSPAGSFYRSGFILYRINTNLTGSDPVSGQMIE